MKESYLKLTKWNADKLNYHTFDIDKKKLFESIIYYSPFQSSEIIAPERRIVPYQRYLIGALDHLEVPWVGTVDPIPDVQL